MKIDIDKKGFAMDSIVDPIATILIIEDNEDLLELEAFHLRGEGYKVIELTSTVTAESALKEGVDLMLIDRSLDHTEGSEFVAYLRDKGVMTPVIFVSAKGSDEDIEEGFRCGGDDYMKKPFNIKELMYRAKAILRRTSAIKYERLKVRDIVMDFNTHKIFVQNREVELTKLEFKLLGILLKNKNKVLERNYLLQHIWSDSEDTQKRTINVTINRLKKKIDPMNEKNYILPIRGIGYRFN